MAAFLCAVDYTDRRGHEVVLEVWLENDAPVGVTSLDEVEAVLRAVAASGEVPEGWRVSVVEWVHPRSAMELVASDEVPAEVLAEQVQAFDAVVRSSEVQITEHPELPRFDEGGGGGAGASGK
jgi:hypothetical protein